MRNTRFNRWLRTFTKVAVTAILITSLIDMQLSYLLAFLGRDQIAETLSSTVADTIVGVMLGYFLKSLFETFFEKREERLLKTKEENNADFIYDGGTADSVSDYEFNSGGTEKDPR